MSEKTCPGVETVEAWDDGDGHIDEITETKHCPGCPDVHGGQLAELRQKVADAERSERNEHDLRMRWQRRVDAVRTLAATWDAQPGRESFAPTFAEELRQAIDVHGGERADRLTRAVERD